MKLYIQCSFKTSLFNERKIENVDYLRLAVGAADTLTTLLVSRCRSTACHVDAELQPSWPHETNMLVLL